MKFYQRNQDCEFCGSKVYYVPKNRKVFCRCGKTNQTIAPFSSWSVFWEILGGHKFKEVNNRNMFQNQANNYNKITPGQQ